MFENVVCEMAAILSRPQCVIVLNFSVRGSISGTVDDAAFHNSPLVHCLVSCDPISVMGILDIEFYLVKGVGYTVQVSRVLDIDVYWRHGILDVDCCPILVVVDRGSMVSYLLSHLTLPLLVFYDNVDDSAPHPSLSLSHMESHLSAVFLVENYLVQ